MRVTSIPQRRTAALGYALIAGSGALLLIGVPTALLPTPWFGRAIPPRPLDYLLFGLTTALIAALGATYAFPATCAIGERRLTAGGMLAFFAIGCPVCNKLVVLAIGWSGAMTYFAPVQPLIGIISSALLGYTLLARLRALHGTVLLDRPGDIPTPHTDRAMEQRR